MSEPRKSRREAKPTQRLKEFLGEETAKSSTPKASKLLAKAAPTPKASAKNEKLTPAKPTPDKASLPKKGNTKPVAISKATPTKASTPTLKAARAALLRDEEPKVSPPIPAASRANVTQSVKKTPVKEVKKASPAAKGLVEREPEILRTKRVSKPSAKVAEAMEAEAEAEQVVKKPVLTAALKATKLTTIKTTTLSVGRGGRGRGSVGLKDRGRGRGRGRGRPLTQAKFLDEEEDEFDMSVEKDQEDEEDDPEDMEGELMDVDEEEEVEDEEGLEEEEEEEEEEEDEEEDEPPVNINKLKKGPTKPDSVVKKPIALAERNSFSESGNKGSGETSVPSAVKASLTGAVLNPIVKKVVSSASSPIKVTSQAPRKDSDPSMSPVKSATVKQVVRAGTGGVKRILTAASPPTSPVAKKVKLSSDESSSSAGEVSSPANVPPKPVPVKTQPVAAVTISSSVAAANGMRQKISTVKTVTKTIPTAAKVPPKTGFNKMESAVVNDAENRRSRRQPKPTERMKEFLHKSSEEEEEDEDDPSAMLDDNDIDSEEEMDDDDDDDDEESSRRFLEFMNKAAGGQKNKKPEPPKGSKIPPGVGKALPQKFIKTQLIRKGSQSSPTPMGRGSASTVVAQNKVSNAVVGALKTPKVVQVQRAKFAPGSKVMVQPPTSVNGDLRKGTVASGLSSSGSGAVLKAVTAGASKKTEPRRAPSEAPVFIKIRTRKPEEDEILRKKREEEDQQAGERKIIKIYTQGRSGKAVSRSGSSKGSFDQESESMESEEEESEADESTEAKGAKPLSGKNEKLIRLCEEAIESLKQGLKSHKKEPSQKINTKTIEKFIRLSTEIAHTVKETVNELGDKISNSDNFEEYCQDVLDSISFKYNEDDITHDEADSLLAWLREQEKESQKGGAARSADRSSQLVLYSQMLELLTAANDEGNDGTFDEEEEMEDEDEEMMDMDDEANYKYYGDAGDDGDEMDDDEIQEEEEEDDFGGEEDEEMEEEEEEAADDPPPVANPKSQGRR